MRKGKIPKDDDHDLPMYDRGIESDLAILFTDQRKQLFEDTRSCGQSSFSQDAVAARAGMSGANLSHLESGTAYPGSTDGWRSWAEALGNKITFRIEFNEDRVQRKFSAAAPESGRGAREGILKICRRPADGRASGNTDPVGTRQKLTFDARAVGSLGASAQKQVAGGSNHLTRHKDWAFENKMAETLKNKREGLFWKTAFSGDWVRRRGECNPYGIPAVSEKIGVCSTALWNWENGVSVPSSQEKWVLWATAVDAEIKFRLKP